MSPGPLALLGLAVLAGCGPNGPTPPVGGYGKFVGTVKTEWIDTGSEMTLLEDFSYIGPDNAEWKCPKGSKIDGASIPQFLWTVIGSPYTGLYRKASVPHDIACQERKKSSDEVHLMFYNACLAAGCSETDAKVLYAGVLIGGPDWEVAGGPVTPAAAGIENEEFENAKADIEARKPPLAQVKAMAKSRTFPQRATTRPLKKIELIRGDRPAPPTNRKLPLPVNRTR
jgi:Protein of unknown function (DUF1353)